MMVCVECLPADKPWDMVSVTRRSSGMAPRACVRVYARVLVPPNLYIHKYINTAVRVGEDTHGILLSMRGGACGGVSPNNFLCTPL